MKACRGVTDAPWDLLHRGVVEGGSAVADALDAPRKRSGRAGGPHDAYDAGRSSLHKLRPQSGLDFAQLSTTIPSHSARQRLKRLECEFWGGKRSGLLSSCQPMAKHPANKQLGKLRTESLK